MEKLSQQQETQQVLDGYFRNVNEKDAEGVASYFAEEIDWYIFESQLMPWTGRRTKKTEVAPLLRQLFDAHAAGEDQFEIDHLFIDGNEAAVFGMAGRRVKATGKKFSAHFCMRFTIQNGLIIRFLMLEDSHEIEKAFI